MGVDSSIIALLREQGVIAPDVLERALSEAETKGVPPENLLVQTGLLSSADLIALLRLREERRLSGGADASSGRAVGSVIDRYRILGEIARGGMGVVYLARDEVLGRELALKLLKAGLGSSPRLRERFVREARLQTALRHPGIAQIFDAGEAGDRPYIAMELVSGPSLDGVIKDEPDGLDPVWAAKTVRDLALAIDYAHRKGIIHRDLKPQNVLLDEGGHPKVVDFGLARLADQASRLTREGQLLGTPFYMSPEQLRGKDADHRADIYALGIILYEMLAGKRPYEANSLAELVRLVDQGFPAPSAVQPDVPPSLDAIVARATAPEPDDRYASARDLATDLDGYLAGAPIARPRRLGRRARAAVLGAVLFTAACAGGLLLVRGLGGPAGGGDPDPGTSGPEGLPAGPEAGRPAAPVHPLVAEARALEAQGKDEEALPLYDRAAAEGDAEAFYRRGRLHGRAGRFDAAQADLSTAVEMRPDDPEILFYRGQALMALGRNPEARDDFRSFVDRTPAGTDHRGDACRFLALIEAQAGWTEAASASLDRALREGPVDAEPFVDLGREFRRRGEYVRAQDALDLALRADPTLDAARTERRGVAVERAADDARAGRIPAARAALEAARSEGPCDAGPFVSAMRDARRQQNLALALDISDLALLLDPDDRRVLVDRSEIAIELGRYVIAIDATTQLLADDPNDFEVLLRRSVAYFNSGRMREAHQDLLRAQSISPDEPRVLSNLIAIYANEGPLRDLDSALAYANRFIEIAPQSPIPHHLRALTLFHLGRLDEAREEIRQAFDLARGSSDWPQEDAARALARELGVRVRH